MDTLSKSNRSALMSRVRSRGNATTESSIAKAFRLMAIAGWRRHVCLRMKSHTMNSIRTYPDFIFRRHRVAVFVDGCFWHGCREHCSTPKTNMRWWREKLAANRTRDRLVTKVLRAHGWKVIRMWEHDVRARPQHCVLRVKKALKEST